MRETFIAPPLTDPSTHVQGSGSPSNPIFTNLVKQAWYYRRKLMNDAKGMGFKEGVVENHDPKDWYHIDVYADQWQELLHRQAIVGLDQLILAYQHTSLSQEEALKAYEEALHYIKKIILPLFEAYKFQKKGNRQGAAFYQWLKTLAAQGPEKLCSAASLEENVNDYWQVALEDCEKQLKSAIASYTPEKYFTHTDEYLIKCQEEIRIHDEKKAKRWSFWHKFCGWVWNIEKKQTFIALKISWNIIKEAKQACHTKDFAGFLKMSEMPEKKKVLIQAVDFLSSRKEKTLTYLSTAVSSLMTRIKLGFKAKVQRSVEEHLEHSEAARTIDAHQVSVQVAPRLGENMRHAESTESPLSVQSQLSPEEQLAQDSLRKSVENIRGIIIKALVEEPESSIEDRKWLLEKIDSAFRPYSYAEQPNIASQAEHYRILFRQSVIAYQKSLQPLLLKLRQQIQAMPGTNDEHFSIAVHLADYKKMCAIKEAVSLSREKIFQESADFNKVDETIWQTLQEKVQSGAEQKMLTIDLKLNQWEMVLVNAWREKANEIKSACEGVQKKIKALMSAPKKDLDTLLQSIENERHIEQMYFCQVEEWMQMLEAMRAVEERPILQETHEELEQIQRQFVFITFPPLSELDKVPVLVAEAKAGTLLKKAQAYKNIKLQLKQFDEVCDTLHVQGSARFGLSEAEVLSLKAAYQAYKQKTLAAEKEEQSQMINIWGSFEAQLVEDIQQELVNLKTKQKILLEKLNVILMSKLDSDNTVASNSLELQLVQQVEELRAEHLKMLRLLQENLSLSDDNLELKNKINEQINWWEESSVFLKLALDWAAQYEKDLTQCAGQPLDPVNLERCYERWCLFAQESQVSIDKKRTESAEAGISPDLCESVILHLQKYAIKCYQARLEVFLQAQLKLKESETALYRSLNFGSDQQNLSNEQRVTMLSHWELLSTFPNLMQSQVIHFSGVTLLFEQFKEKRAFWQRNSEQLRDFVQDIATQRRKWLAWEAGSYGNDLERCNPDLGGTSSQELYQMWLYYQTVLQQVESISNTISKKEDTEDYVWQHAEKSLDPIFAQSLQGIMKKAYSWRTSLLDPLFNYYKAMKEKRYQLWVEFFAQDNPLVHFANQSDSADESFETLAQTFNVPELEALLRRNIQLCESTMNALFNSVKEQYPKQLNKILSDFGDQESQIKYLEGFIYQNKLREWESLTSLYAEHKKGKEQLENYLRHSKQFIAQSLQAFASPEAQAHMASFFNFIEGEDELKKLSESMQEAAIDWNETYPVKIDFWKIAQAKEPVSQGILEASRPSSLTIDQPNAKVAIALARCSVSNASYFIQLRVLDYLNNLLQVIQKNKEGNLQEVLVKTSQQSHLKQCAEKILQYIKQFFQEYYFAGDTPKELPRPLSSDPSYKEYTKLIEGMKEIKAMMNKIAAGLKSPYFSITFILQTISSLDNLRKKSIAYRGMVATLLIKQRENKQQEQKAKEGEQEIYSYYATLVKEDRLVRSFGRLPISGTSRATLSLPASSALSATSSSTELVQTKASDDGFDALKAKLSMHLKMRGDLGQGDIMPIIQVIQELVGLCGYAADVKGVRPYFEFLANDITPTESLENRADELAMKFVRMRYGTEEDYAFLNQHVPDMWPQLMTIEDEKKKKQMLDYIIVHILITGLNKAQVYGELREQFNNYMACADKYLADAEAYVKRADGYIERADDYVQQADNYVRRVKAQIKVEDEMQPQIQQMSKEVEILKAELEANFPAFREFVHTKASDDGFDALKAKLSMHLKMRGDLGQGDIMPILQVIQELLGLCGYAADVKGVRPYFEFLANDVTPTESLKDRADELAMKFVRMKHDPEGDYTFLQQYVPDMWPQLMTIEDDQKKKQMLDYIIVHILITGLNKAQVYGELREQFNNYMARADKYLADAEAYVKRADGYIERADDYVQRVKAQIKVEDEMQPQIQQMSKEVEILKAELEANFPAFREFVHTKASDDGFDALKAQRTMCSLSILPRTPSIQIMDEPYHPENDQLNQNRLRSPDGSTQIVHSPTSPCLEIARTTGGVSFWVAVPEAGVLPSLMPKQEINKDFARRDDDPRLHHSSLVILCTT